MYMEKQYYTLTEVKKLGFNPKMIEELLPDPILRTNPHYRRAAPMKLWEQCIVEEAMNNEKFIVYKTESDKRRQSAKKAVQTKYDKLHKEVEKKISEIYVQKIDNDRLRKETLRNKQAWYDYQECIRNKCSYMDAYSANEDTQKRWMVNFIRHNLMDYDDDLYKMSGKTGCHREYVNYKSAVLQKIAETYPELAEECQRQMTRDINSNIM